MDKIILPSRQILFIKTEHVTGSDPIYSYSFDNENGLYTEIKFDDIRKLLMDCDVKRNQIPEKFRLQPKIVFIDDTIKVDTEIKPIVEIPHENTQTSSYTWSLLQNLHIVS
jgi:hypothetical protein